MPTTRQRNVSDLRGSARLATEATLGLAALVEAMHAGIARVPGTALATQTRGITGLVYRSVRGVTRLVGGTVDGLLALLTPWLAGDAGATSASPREREAVLAALGGVLGDHLASSHNPLAIEMALRHQGRVMSLDRQELQAAFPDSGGRVLVLLHGLCMNDLQWRREGHDHGAALAHALGYTPLYLHYNSGLPVHVNGAAFAALMQALLQAWPHPLQRVALLCHSMGGLLARSALHQGAAARHSWPKQVDDVVFLGTPHHGAPLERAGHGIDMLLDATPYAAPLARLGRLRSAGITDLRHGSVLGPESAGVLVPLPDQPRCHTVAACIKPGAKVLGDGLVPLDSALGRHADPARCLQFAADSQVQLSGINHMQLLSQPQVLQPLLRWLK